MNKEEQEEKNYCTDHKDFFTESCFSCKKFLCLTCKKGHLDHKTKNLSKFVLKNFKLIGIIGKGPNSSVFEVNVNAGKKKLALKIIENVDEDSYLNFQKKVNEVLNSLHQNIWYYESTFYNEEEKFIGILMNIADSDLKKKIKQDNNVDLPLYCMKICKILENLHQKQNLVHGNLKLQNILLFNDEIFFTDFAAFHCNNNGKKKNLVPPELIISQKNHEFNEKHDIWSLGVILHQILTKNANPFLFEDGAQNEKTSTIQSNIMTEKFCIHPTIKSPVFTQIIKSSPNNNIF